MQKEMRKKSKLVTTKQNKNKGTKSGRGGNIDTRNTEN